MYCSVSVRLTIIPGFPEEDETADWMVSAEDGTDRMVPQEKITKINNGVITKAVNLDTVFSLVNQIIIAEKCQGNISLKFHN
jgi:hypothetical protein